MEIAIAYLRLVLGLDSSDLRDGENSLGNPNQITGMMFPPSSKNFPRL